MWRLPQYGHSVTSLVMAEVVVLYLSAMFLILHEAYELRLQAECAAFVIDMVPA